MNIKDEQPAFSEWFDAVWLGDLEHGQRIPTIQDSDYGEYLEARQLAQGAWMHRAQIAATDVAVEKSWRRFEDKMAVPAQAQPLRLPEPMTDSEIFGAMDRYEVEGYDIVRWAEAETLRRVREANNG